MATLSVSPNPATPGQVVTVTGTGFVWNKFVRLRLDGVIVVAQFHPENPFRVTFPVSPTSKTQTLIAEQQVKGSTYQAVASVSIVVQGVAAGPIISNITVGNIGQTSAGVSWVTNTPATGQVDYGPTTAYGASTPLDSGYKTAHVQMPSPLLPNTTYHYRVKSTDQAGIPAVSADQPTFQTAAAPPPAGVIAQFPGTGANSPAAFLALMGNMNIDTIEMAAGTYTDWHVYIRLSRAARPLLIRPASGAAVVWNGGSNGAGLFHFGTNVGSPGVPTFATDYITFDPAGTGGSFTIQNYTIGATGLILTGWVNHLTVNGFKVRTCTGAAGGSTSHCLYVASDDTHRGTNIVANNWDVGPFTSRLVNAVQTYHDPNAAGLTLNGWTVTGCNRAMFLWGDGSGVIADGWTISNCNATFDVAGSVTGVIKNCHATASGPLAPGAGFWTNLGVTNGGGNTSA